MRKRVLLSATAGVILISLTAALIFWGRNESKEVRLADGRLFRIEAVTFGTNHVVGRGDGWLFPLRKILPTSVIQFLTPTRGQSRQNCDRPALIVWVHAYDTSKGQYVDCQGVQAAFVDEQGDVYPANGSAHGSFFGGFNRQANIFYVFPRRPAKLKLQLTPWRSDQSSVVEISNPARQTDVAGWTPEDIPATHQIGNLEITLDSLVIKTNGGPTRHWEPTSRHWQPVLKLTPAGASTDWEPPEWIAEDTTGNRGQTLALHEPLLKFTATTRPKPDALLSGTNQWRLPLVSLPTTPLGIQWNTNRLWHDMSITVIGLFPPGAYTFTQGQLTNAPGRTAANQGWTGLSKQVAPGRWQHWQTFTTTNYVAYVRRTVSSPEQRLAVALRDEAGRASWGQCTTSEERDAILPFAFNVQPGTQPVALDIVLLEPVQTQFVVKPPVDRPSSGSSGR